MPILEKYRELSQKLPKKNDQVILYEKINISSKQGFVYTKVSEDPMVFISNAGDQLIFLYANDDIYVVSKENLSNYQFIRIRELNMFQKIFGVYYLGFPLFVFIVWMIYQYYQS